MEYRTRGQEEAGEEMNLRSSACRGLLLVSILASINLAAYAEQSAVRPGDRIAIVGNTFADQLRIHGYLETLLLQHTKDEPVSIRNLGWGGDMLSARDRPTNFPTEESTLSAHETDVIIACFGMGESFAGADGLDDFKGDLNAFLASHKGRSYNGESEVRLILVSPIAYEDLGALTPAHEKRNLELGAYTTAMKEVAAGAEVPFVNVFDDSGYLMREWEDGDFTTNGIHLNATGYWAISRIMFAQLTTAPHPSWRIRIDAESAKADANGVSLSKVTRVPGGLTFRVTENAAPSLPPPTEHALPLQLSSRRDTLIVTRLKPGLYTLTVDGQTVASGSHEDWAEGVSIDSSPAHHEAEALRAAVNDKNLQFAYSWKALNQVHIVGERRKSPSGRALPGEVTEFNKLAEEREHELGGMIKRRTREWQLTRSKEKP